MSQQSLVETLEGTYFLHGLPQEYLEQIAKAARIRDCDELDTVFREGDFAEHVYLVVSGIVSLEMCAPGVGCKRILTVGPGELLAWSGLTEQARLTATARTLEVTRLVEIDAAQLLSMCQRNPSLGYEIMCRTMQTVSGRLSATRMQLVNVYGSQMPAATSSGGTTDGC